ncbi:MAG: DUF5681 domain-containing protein [Alphaproteobacteria bacterium]
MSGARRASDPTRYGRLVKVRARNESGRFIKGASGSPALRYAKGRSGNPRGRPRGSGRFRAGTRAAAALLDQHAEFVAQQAIELVRAGDPVAVRFCLGRILGVRRGQPVELDLTSVAAPGDLTAAVAAITGAVAAGQITPDEALSLSQMLDGLPRVFAAIPPPPLKDREDPREKLIRELDRIAERETLRQSQALATIPHSNPAGRLAQS